MKRPLSITIIGIVFILGGLLSIWNVLYDLFRGQVNINFAVLLVFVGIGLLKLKSSSRLWAIFWIILGYILCGILVVGYFVSPRFSVRIGVSEVQGPLRFLIGIGIPIILAALFYWMHRILISPGIKVVFLQKGAPDQVAEESTV